MAITLLFLYTKPTDEECTEIGKEIVFIRVANKVPGFPVPTDTTLDSAAKASLELIIIKNKIFWKEIDYSWNNNARTLGYAYLKAVHIKR
jgi:hypothetical protein